MPTRKRKKADCDVLKPRNRYTENPPDFSLLASLYPSFEKHVFYSTEGRARIDWKDFHATRELTRVLLLHDHGINWWIPDGHLCPTVPNRLNYVHWISALLSSGFVEPQRDRPDGVMGFDIGTGANCIYPLLGSSLYSWRFVASDVSDEGIEWAERNVRSNPHVAGLIEIRRAKSAGLMPPVLVGVVGDGETFDFCMCNPPFFSSIAESCLNPKTSCGGTHTEMVFPGGERAFVSRIIEDSSVLTRAFAWYTSMVGRKADLKVLAGLARGAGATLVRTTEFVQGRTSRWGLAWSFLPPTAAVPRSRSAPLNFTLDGVDAKLDASRVIRSVHSFFASCTTTADMDAFRIQVAMSEDQCNAMLRNTGSAAPSAADQSDLCHLQISVFQQNPGSLLVKGALQAKDTGALCMLFRLLEESLKEEFCRRIVDG